MEERKHIGEGTSPSIERANIENPRDMSEEELEEEHVGAAEGVILGGAVGGDSEGVFQAPSHPTADEIVAEAEDELGLEPKVVKDSLLHGPDYDEVEES